MKPEIIIPNFEGISNTTGRAEKLTKEKTYRDLSTIIICPTRGVIPAKVVQSWMNLIRPMNQRVIYPMFMIGMEVGHAYNEAFKMILNHPELSKWSFICTIEEDNMPPVDGLMKLYESMDEYDVVGGLYWTKGEAGQPQIYGNPNVFPKNFIPQIPIPDTLQPCNGMGMGFHLFKISSLKKCKFDPLFKTLEGYENGGVKIMTQDLYFYEEASKCGLKFACDTRVKVGHYDFENDKIW